jgi:glutamine synthetase
VEGRAIAERKPDRLPRTLIEALDAFGADPLVAEVYGTEFRDIFLHQKSKEWDQAFYRVSNEERDQQVEYV